MRRLTAKQVARQREIHRDNAMVENWEKEKHLMLTAYTIYKADGTVENAKIEWPKEPGYDAIAALINPILRATPGREHAELEHVTVLHPETQDRGDMFVDELGAQVPLPVNEAATKIYHGAWMRAHPGADPAGPSEIYGTAILFHRRIWF